MAAGTLISRITGFIRNILIVALLGTSLLGDSYNVGNTMPNILYNLILGGHLLLSSCRRLFVPLRILLVNHFLFHD